MNLWWHETPLEIIIFPIGIYSIQGWTAAVKHGTARKRRLKMKNIQECWSKGPKIKSACYLYYRLKEISIINQRKHSSGK